MEAATERPQCSPALNEDEPPVADDQNDATGDIIVQPSAKKQGPEPVADAPDEQPQHHQQHHQQQQQQKELHMYWRKKLADFYSVHNPDKLSSVDHILLQYQGQETLLMTRLQEKYCSQPPEVNEPAELTAADRLAAFANEIKSSLLVQRRVTPAASSAQHQSPLSSRSMPSQEAGGDAALLEVKLSHSQHHQQQQQQHVSALELEWREEKQGLLLLVQRLRAAARDAAAERDGLAARLAAVEQQESVTGVRAREAESRALLLQAERDRALTQCQVKQVQLTEALEEQYALASDLDRLLHQLPSFPALATPSPQAEPPAAPPPQPPEPPSQPPSRTAQTALAAARAGAAMTFRRAFEAEEVLRKRDEELGALRERLTEAEVALENRGAEGGSLAEQLAAVEANLQRRHAQMDNLQEQLALLTLENAQLKQDAQVAADALQSAAAARDSLLTFCRQERAAAEQRVSAAAAATAAAAAVQQASLLAATEEVNAAAAAVRSADAAAARREAQAAAAEVVRVRAATARLEAEAALLRHELATAAREIAVLRRQREDSGSSGAAAIAAS